MVSVVNVLLAFVVLTTADVVGKYRIPNSEFGSDLLELKSDGTYTRKMSGCVFDIETTGVWTLSNDTITFQSLQTKDLRSKQIILKDSSTYAVVVKGKSLKPITTPDSVFVEDYYLRKIDEK